MVNLAVGPRRTPTHVNITCLGLATATLRYSQWLYRERSSWSESCEEVHGGGCWSSLLYLRRSRKPLALAV